jgi:hypothetical protein
MVGKGFAWVAASGASSWSLAFVVVAGATPLVGRGSALTTPKATCQSPAAGVALPPALSLAAFDRRQPFYEERTTVLKQEMTVNGMNVSVTRTETFYVRWTPQRKKDGKYVVVQKILRVKAEFETGFRLDTQDQQIRSAKTFFDHLHGSELTYTIGPDKAGRWVVEKVDGVDALRRKMGIDSASPKVAEWIKGQASPERFKHDMEPLFDFLPAGGTVPPGKTWSRSSTFDAGAVGSYRTDNKYTFEGRSDGKAPFLRIKVATDFGFVPRPKQAPGQVVTIIADRTRLMSQGSGGTILFDPAKGRIHSAELITRLQGTLCVNIDNTPTDVPLKHSEVQRRKFTEENPLNAK